MWFILDQFKKWDDGLAAQAQKLADQQTTCEMSHELLTWVYVYTACP